MFENVKNFIVSRQSTLISGLSALVIIVLGFLLFSYFSGVNKQTASRQTVTVEEATSSGLLTEATRSSILDTAKKEATKAAGQVMNKPAQPKQQPASPSTGPKTYTVVSGDTLSSIAAKFYGSTDKYTLIASYSSNRISNPNLIHSGNVFVIPSDSVAVAPATPTTLPKAGIAPDSVSVSPDSNNESLHSVVSGDTLWDLAVKYYNDGFLWTKIASANTDQVGVLPVSFGEKALIVPGQTLVIPSS